MYKLYFKRIIDFSFSFLALLILSPLFLLITILLSIANKGKPFFFQKRPGKNERFFRVVKFKTMNDKVDAAGNLLPPYQRITSVGRILRATSLDEIPQLWNVLIGNMSLIGPRPLLVSYLPRYSQRQARRHEVRPGITGWAQVNGRNAISWEQKFEHDVCYVDHISFVLDMKILWLTFLKVIRREGINAAPDRPMEEFLGS